jgi:hypothetical protein
MGAVMKMTVTDEKSRPKVRNASRAYQRSHGHGSPVTFHGVDTEGSGTGYDHKPVLISCGQDYLAKPEGLVWAEIFTFLYDHFETGGHAYVGFYLAYDFTQWLRTLPEERARKLITPAGVASRTKVLRDGTRIMLPVEHGAWQFDMMGFKRLRIRPKPCHGKCPYPHSARGNGNHRWMYICDVGPFFQSSFLKAIHPDGWPEPIVTREEYDLIERGKKHRSDAVLDDDMIMYQQAEIVALERLMDAQQAGLREMGVFLKPKQWFGPGQIAQELLKQWDVPQSKDIPDFIPESFLYAAQASYYGGWFEIFAHGNVEKAWSYDINSAYPYIIANLPCLRHGRYDSGHGRPSKQENSSTLLLVRASVRRISDTSGWNPDNPGTVIIGSMLHRDKNGRIYRPLDTSGWYWKHELDAAARAGCIERIEYHEWLSYTPCDCPPPMAGIAELYEWRLRIGKNTPLGKGLKLGYNSAYGKVAQSVGHPKFGNAIYASLITAGCRTMILDAIASHPQGQQAVLMVATDGVYFTAPHLALSLSSKLGEWEEEEHDNLTLFKPGVYWDDKAREQIRVGKAPQFKARGVNAKDLGNEITGIDRGFSMWPTNSQKNLCNRPQWKADGSGWPLVSVKSSFAMVSMLQALQRNDWSMAGYVNDSPEIKQSAAHEQKRYGLWWDKNSRIYRSMPRGWESAIYPDMPCPQSKPYEKRFGLEDPWSDEMRQSAGITPDGEVASMLRLLSGE